MQKNAKKLKKRQNTRFAGQKNLTDLTHLTAKIGQIKFSLYIFFLLYFAIIYGHIGQIGQKSKKTAASSARPQKCRIGQMVKNAGFVWTWAGSKNLTKNPNKIARRFTWPACDHHRQRINMATT